MFTNITTRDIIKKLIIWYIFLMSLLSLNRLLLFIIYQDRIFASGVNYYLSFLYGLKMDTIIVCYALSIPTILLLLLPKIFSNIINKILNIYFLIILLLIILAEAITIPFFSFYDARPNEMFINYLQYPKEVIQTIYKAYAIELIVILIICFIVTKIYMSIKEDFSRFFKVNYLKRILLFIPLSLILFIGMRSSFGHRAANLSSVTYSKSHLVNEISKNSVYSIAYTIYAQMQYSANVKEYGDMDIKEAIRRVRKRLNINNTNKDIPFLRKEKTNFKSDYKKNIVIFIQESMGARFISSLNGKKGLSPNIDKLSKESIFFTNMHSVGTRSVRGLAAIISGYIPLPGRGVIKRPKGNPNFFTIAELLKAYNYKTGFIYGGEKDFDNMGAWFYGNGFDEVIDEKSYENPIFKGTWGVSDEDLVKKANQRFKELTKKNENFAYVIFSSSNHTPYEFPENRIKLVDGVEKNSVENAIKYADYAIGEFFKLAKKEKYYKDTVFLVIADHDVRVYGKDLVPIKAFHIPAFIIADGIKAMKYNKVSYQPDALATAIDLLGFDTKHLALGKSIFNDKKNEIAFMKFYDNYALRYKNKVSILLPGKKPLSFLYENFKLKAIKDEEELGKDLLAFIIVSSYLYENRLHSLVKK